MKMSCQKMSPARTHTHARARVQVLTDRNVATPDGCQRAVSSGAACGRQRSQSSCTYRDWRTSNPSLPHLAFYTHTRQPTNTRGTSIHTHIRARTQALACYRQHIRNPYAPVGFYSDIDGTALGPSRRRNRQVQSILL